MPVEAAVALVGRLVRRHSGGAASMRLTAREVEVLAGLEAGLTYREIGARLGISWRTAQTHAYRVYRKLEVPGRYAAVREARARRII